MNVLAKYNMSGQASYIWVLGVKDFTSATHQILSSLAGEALYSCQKSAYVIDKVGRTIRQKGLHIPFICG